MFKKAEKVAYYLSLFISVFIVLGIYSSLSPYGFNNLFNSDSLYMASLYRDIFVDGNTLRGWDLNTAPLIFPNVLLFSIFNAITGNFKIAYFLHAVFQYIGLLLAINYLFYSVKPKLSKTVAASANLLIGLLLISFFLKNEAFTFSLFFLPYHIGAFIITVLCLSFLIRYLDKNNSKYLWLIALFTLLTSISDKIFLAYFSIASVCTLFCLKILSEYSWKRILKAAITITLSTIYALVIMNAISRNGYISITRTQLLVGERILPSFKIMVDQYFNYLIYNNLTGAIFKLSVIALIFILIKLYLVIKETNLKTERNLSLTFYLFTIIFVFGIWLAPAISGVYLGNDAIRYNIWVIILLIAAFPLLINEYFKKEILNFSLFFLILFSVVSVTIFFVSNNKVNGISSYFNYNSELAAKADSIAKKHSLKNGIGEYWSSKEITMFSKTGLRVYSVFDDLNPYVLSSNKNWYCDYNNRKSGKDFNFIILYKTSIYADSVKYKFLPDSITITPLGDDRLLFIVPPFHYEYGVPGIVISHNNK